MPQTITNEGQLKAIIERLAEEALEAVADRVLKKFKEDFVEPIVLNSHGPNSVYEKTGQFEDAWEWTALKKDLKTLSKEMWYNPSKMTLDRKNFVHGSNYPPNDARTELMDILNKSGYSSSLWVSVRRPAPYWDVFILAAFQGGLLSKIINEEFSKRGFKKV